MGVRVIGDNEYAALYCSSTMWAFGPVFEEYHKGNKFANATEMATLFSSFCYYFHGDPRHFTDIRLGDTKLEFFKIVESLPDKEFFELITDEDWSCIV